jgi:hypothetical protein
MKFKQDEVDELLAKCHRRCSICHRFCGSKMETDHIILQSEEGNDNIDNAIPLCFDCHAEVHSYNNKHPRGRKYHPNELKKHKEQWLKICATSPQIFTERIPYSDGGPFSGLFSEIEFNNLIVQNNLDIPFEVQEFHKIVSSGELSLLSEKDRNEIMSSYALLKINNSYFAQRNPDLINIEREYRNSLWENHRDEMCKSSLQYCLNTVKDVLSIKN